LGFGVLVDDHHPSFRKVFGWGLSWGRSPLANRRWLPRCDGLVGVLPHVFLVDGERHRVDALGR
jgi:hypothetical protein